MLFSPVSYILWRTSSTGLISRAPTQCWRFLSIAAEPLIKPVRIINQPAGMQFSISRKAATRLADIYKDSKEVLKISVESGGCHGFQYNMRLVPEKKVDTALDAPKQNPRHAQEDVKEKDSGDSDDFDDDFEANKKVVFILPDSEAKVVIDENSLKILNKTTLTYSTELIGSTFKISGGNMKSSCGCGSSFDVDLEN
ncbi:hypothetical protein HG535_0A02270 [Zygotorulaspora mrakii]|uniref:FeS cluster biogenesis domain-containing protein n=1 Tax=Zygotorulaspora mrakii TaxID=42260 RepID=A0A7H9AWY1_ZYGMR|nr:uncharacterized protein HG535_0A02270 [Zygotorulaspora mrakii]QLG70289.1 hypothetical protein HG535_0A02270 [Zygotorulaspora mrakii]